MQPSFTNFKKMINRIFFMFFIVGLALSKLQAQTVVTTDYSAQPMSFLTAANSFVTFTVTNSNAIPVTLTKLDCYASTTSTVGSSTGTLWFSATSLSGAPTIATPAWTQIATGSAVSITANGYYTFLSGLTFVVPANTTYRFAFVSSNGLIYGGSASTPNSATADGIILGSGNYQLSSQNVGWTGALPNPGVNNPRFFSGKLYFTVSGCTSAPTPGNTISSVTSVCPTINFNLSLQNQTSGSGVSYQWQSSSDGTTWANVNGATNATLTTSQTAATYYRCQVTCSGNTGTSTPVLVSLAPNSSCYCAAGATSTAFEKISNVTFGTINNNSTSTAGYENFLTQSTNVIAGQTLPISVSLSNGFSSDVVRVWIDFNQDGDFTDAGEAVYVSAQGVGPHVGNITIPGSATIGSTRMRVRMYDASFGANTTP